MKLQTKDVGANWRGFDWFANLLLGHRFLEVDNAFFRTHQDNRTREEC